MKRQIDGEIFKLQSHDKTELMKLRQKLIVDNYLCKYVHRRSPIVTRENRENGEKTNDLLERFDSYANITMEDIKDWQQVHRVYILDSPKTR
jgi:hypothetical protein